MDVQSLSAIKKAKAALEAKVEALGLSVGTKVDNLSRDLSGALNAVKTDVGAKIDAQTATLTTEHDATQALLGDVGAVLDKINGEVV